MRKVYRAKVSGVCAAFIFPSPSIFPEIDCIGVIAVPISMYYRHRLNAHTMNSITLNEKLSECLALYAQVLDAPLHPRRQDFVALSRKLAGLIGMPPDTEFKILVGATGRMIGELAEYEKLDDHRRWLDGYNPQHKRKWEEQLQQNSDGAKCEMLVRMLLEENGNKVMPNADLSAKKKAPDFRCTQEGQLFYVEVTCVDSDRATRVTSLEPKPEAMAKAYAFADINQALFEKLEKKHAQCKHLEHPVLVAIGTLHFHASALTFHDRFVRELLTGKGYVSANLSHVKKTFLSTQLEYASFLQQDALTGEIVTIHKAVSGLLLCGFGCEPSIVNGLLHPEPSHVFDRCLLKNVPFFRLASGYDAGQLSVEAL